MKHDKEKLLHIVEAMGGGVFTYIVDLANGLCDEYEIYVAYGLRDQTPEDFEDYFDNRIHLIRVENFTREVSLKKDPKAIKEVRRIVKEIQPDVIHLHSSKAGIVGRLFVGRGYKKFYTPHGYSFLMNDISYKKRLVFHGLELIASRLSKCTTIACSMGELEEAQKMSRRSVCINNGIDIEILGRDIHNAKSLEHDTKSEKFTVVTLGRICEQKNPKLFNEVAERMPDTRFVWIGDGELRNEITSSNIEITGWLDRMSAVKHAMDADAFVLTSLWEGLPISLLEAMYLRKVCIVSNVIGNKDVIKNNVNGFVCETVEDYVNAINIVKSGEDIKRLTDAAYIDLDEKYNSANVCKQYSRAYKG